MESPDISLVIPAWNEAESVAILYKESITVLQGMGVNYEIIFIDDGSTDETPRVLQGLFDSDSEHVRVIGLPQHAGKAVAMATGFAYASGNIIITMDADLQDDPIEIPRFVAKLQEGYDLVCGWKRDRKDPLEKVLASKFYNKVNSIVSGVSLHDHNCGFKAYRSAVAKRLPLDGDLHRYVPFLAHAYGFTRIVEMPVHHRARQYGKSKYGISRYITGIVGLLGAYRISRQIAAGRLEVSEVYPRESLILYGF